MNAIDIVLVAAIALATVLAAARLIRNRRKGKCACGCENCACGCDKKKS